MSVLKSKRSISHTQFLSNLQKLENEVLTWCKSQGDKNSNYGLTDLFNSTQKAFVSALQGNKIYLKTNEDAELRKKYFNLSIRWLHTFNAQLTAMMSCFPISNTKLKRWSSYAYQAINQIENIKKSDTARIKKIKLKNN